MSLAGCVFVFLFLFVLIAAGASYYLLTTPQTMPQNYRLIINQGDNWQTIAKQLKQDNLIQNEKAFVCFDAKYGC